MTYHIYINIYIYVFITTLCIDTYIYILYNTYQYTSYNINIYVCTFAALQEATQVFTSTMPRAVSSVSWCRAGIQLIQPSLGMSGWYPLVNIQKATENGHRNSGFTQLENVVDLSIANCKRLPEGKWYKCLVIQNGLLCIIKKRSVTIQNGYIYICFNILWMNDCWLMIGSGVIISHIFWESWAIIYVGAPLKQPIGFTRWPWLLLL